MPILNGYESTKKIRDFEQIHNLEPCHIVGLSGEQSVESEKLVKLCKMSESLLKPISRNQMQ